MHHHAAFSHFHFLPSSSISTMVGLNLNIGTDHAGLVLNVITDCP